ncbi:hypothetical protein [Planctomycetes bacterium CA13]
MAHWTANLIRFVLLASVVFSKNAVAAEPSPPNYAIGQWKAKLGSHDYAVRRNAHSWLLAKSNDDTERDVLMKQLGQGLFDADLEVRLQCQRLLDDIRQQAMDLQVARLRDANFDAAEVKLNGWTEFSRIVGDDSSSRDFYANLYDRYAARIDRMIEREASAEPSVKTRYHANHDSDVANRTYSIHSGDIIAWSLLLFADCLPKDRKLATKQTISLTSQRIMSSLSHSGLGPTPTKSDEVDVIARLVDQWLRGHSQSGNLNDQLKIAMRYRCTELAAELSVQILREPGFPPAWQATAMLAATALEPGLERFTAGPSDQVKGSKPNKIESSFDLDAVLLSRLSDSRTAYAWQLIPSRKATLHTLVCDVAMASLLHRRQIDPRLAGFEELQAHPWLLFRDHSLGFRDENSRMVAHHKARELIESLNVSERSGK